MAKIEVILTSNIIGLGAESDQVKVAAGYARNYLLPQGLAVPLTATNKRRIESLRQRRAEREAHELNTMTELAASLSKIVLKIVVKTGADGKMFGSVTAGTIADELKHQCDVMLDKRKIHVEHAIRTLGEHEIELNLHPDVKAKLKIIIESATPAELAAVPFEARSGRAAREARAGGEKTAAEARPAKEVKTVKARPEKKAKEAAA
jgi:large subunit ribosomal protein L9